MTYTKVLAFVAFRLSVLLIMASSAAAAMRPGILTLPEVFQSLEEIKSSEASIVLISTDISSYSLKETFSESFFN